MKVNISNLCTLKSFLLLFSVLVIGLGLGTCSNIAIFDDGGNDPSYDPPYRLLYIITKNAESSSYYTAARADADLPLPGAEKHSIQGCINVISADAINEESFAIQFGNGTDELDIGTNGATFPGRNITLLGKVTSNKASNLFTVPEGAVINSKAEIRYTANTANLFLISGGALIISDGLIEATGVSGIAIHIKFTDGAVTINDGTVQAKGLNGIAICNDYGALTINGGEIKAKGDRGVAVCKDTPIAVTIISGGFVEATGVNGTAVYNYSTSAVTITGCKIQANLDSWAISGRATISPSVEIIEGKVDPKVVMDTALKI